MNNNIPGALVGFLILLPATILLGLLTAVRVLLTLVFLLIVAAVDFFSVLQDDTLEGLDVGSFITVAFAVTTALSDASLI